MGIFGERPPKTLMEAVRRFDPETSRAYVQSIKWPGGPCCCKCGSVNIGRIKSRAKYQCREKGCRAQFSLTTDTIFEGTHLRLDQWMAAVWQIVNCRNGVSSCEIARALGIKQQSAWHLLHRIRHILQQDRSEQMGQNHGAVEGDTTFVGGILKNMTYERHQRAKKRGRHGKVEVLALRERKSGKVRATVVPSRARGFVQSQMAEDVAPGAMVYTDCAKGHRWLTYSRHYRHAAVNHSILEYVRGEAHVNGCENYFNCLRRALKGTYIRATPEHLPAYVDEATYRFNIRGQSEWERFDGAMRMIVGKRLTYSTLTDGATR